MRRSEEIREEMRRLKAPRPDHYRTAQDWLKLQKHNELYAEWIEAITSESDEND
jgi:hypothetical protein